ncbi:MAG: Holliday junction resolvase RuvX [Bacteroidetes bacterium]|jgi:putative Holliday junction resolvase|nr:MAG: Holliday junction resolvase RuvX [Bacteroidota bacterium]
MPRLLAIDYGLKRTGLAVTDNLKIIATALTTVPTAELLSFLQKYAEQEEIEAFVIGLPVSLQGDDTDTTPHVQGFARVLANRFPNVPIHWIDERFTSKLALDAMIRAGSTKKDRREKGNIDKVSATIILQSFMENYI